MIRPMLLHDEMTVREIFKFCYSDDPNPEIFWFFANPTLVYTSDETGDVLGYTSFTIAVMPGHGKTMFGQHVLVHPDHRGKGIALELHKARLRVGADVGCEVFIGSADPENKAIVKIFESTGLHQCVPTKEKAYLYVGAIKDV